MALKATTLYWWCRHCCSTFYWLRRI